MLKRQLGASSLSSERRCGCPPSGSSATNSYSELETFQNTGKPGDQSVHTTESALCDASARKREKVVRRRKKRTRTRTGRSLSGREDHEDEGWAHAPRAQG